MTFPSLAEINEFTVVRHRHECFNTGRIEELNAGADIPNLTIDTNAGKQILFRVYPFLSARYTWFRIRESRCARTMQFL